MNRCAMCGRAAPTSAFCGRDCERNHQQMKRVLLQVDAKLIERVFEFSRDAGAGYAATWDRLVRTVLDRAGAQP